MHRAILCVAVVVLSCVASAHAQAGKKKIDFSIENVEQAIEKGRAYLLSKQDKATGSFGNYHDEKDQLAENHPRWEIGPTALAVIAILESSPTSPTAATAPAGQITVTSPEMVKAMDHITAKVNARIAQSLNPPKEGNPSVPYAKTYELGLAALAYQTALKQQPKNEVYASQLAKVADFLVRHTNHGGYTYDIRKPVDGKFAATSDNSNAQYGLLGVWAWTLAETSEVPVEYWTKVLKHWQDTQCNDGGWGYQQPGLRGYGAMTAAGLASMFVCYDNLFADAEVNFVALNVQRSIQRGLDWLDKNFEASLESASSWPQYYLYGVERVGLASGYKYFGTTDWYKLGCNRLLNSQNQQNGSIGDVVNTSFGMLFLIRGRHPVLFNKLQHDNMAGPQADWNNRSRDLAMVTRWLTKQFEDPVNWQIINTKVPVSEWHDAPILYIAGSKPPKFSEEELAKLKLFVEQGGTILAMSENGNFSTAMSHIWAKMFPNYKYGPAPLDHPLYTCQENLKGRPKFSIVSNGVRPLVIQIDQDLGRAWQLRQWGGPRGQPWAFDAAANIETFITDKKDGFRPRGSTLWPDLTEAPLTQKVGVVRLKHEGNWNPEPAALDRFKLLMANHHKVDVQIAEPVAIAELGSGATKDIKVAFLTGTGKLTLKAEDHAAMKAFVGAGGTLIVDAAGGNAEFAKSAEDAIKAAFPDMSLKTLASTAPVYQLKGMQIDTFKPRRGTKTRSRGEPDVMALFNFDNKPVVFFSHLDITGGLVGYSCFGVDGYHPGSYKELGTAFKLCRNIVMHAHGLEGQAAATQPADASAQK